MARSASKGGIHSDGLKELVTKNKYFKTIVREVDNGYVVYVEYDDVKLYISTHNPPEPRVFSTLDAIRSYCIRVGIGNFKVQLSN